MAEKEEMPSKEKEVEEWLQVLKNGGIKLAVLAAIRREESTSDGVRDNMRRYTAGIMSVNIKVIEDTLDELEKQHHIESYTVNKGGKSARYYKITSEGKSFMYDLLKQWNRFVDSMNNLWGCYYST